MDVLLHLITSVFIFCLQTQTAAERFLVCLKYFSDLKKTPRCVSLTFRPTAGRHYPFMTLGCRNIEADWPGLEGIWLLWLAEPGGNWLLIGGNEEAWLRARLRQSKHKTKRPKRVDHTHSGWNSSITNTHNLIESKASHTLWCRQTQRGGRVYESTRRLKCDRIKIMRSNWLIFCSDFFTHCDLIITTEEQNIWDVDWGTLSWLQWLSVCRIRKRTPWSDYHGEPEMMNAALITVFCINLRAVIVTRWQNMRL